MFDALILVLLCLLGIPVAVFAIECGLGLVYRQKNEPPRVPKDLKTAIVVPAHNEEAIIGKTLTALKEQLDASDQVVVVADNCDDQTADIVREYGFIALERSNDSERGKGYALDYAIQYLKQQQQQPDIVIIVDADCLLGADALTWLKHQVYTPDTRRRRAT